MKGVSAVVWIVIVIIVMLVAALVVLSIFGGGVTQVATFSEARSLCITQGTATCMTTGSLPATWNAPTVMVGTERKACSSSDLAGDCSCTNREFKCGAGPQIPPEATPGVFEEEVY